MISRLTKSSRLYREATYLTRNQDGSANDSPASGAKRSTLCSTAQSLTFESTLPRESLSTANDAMRLSPRSIADTSIYAPVSALKGDSTKHPSAISNATSVHSAM